MKRSVLLLLLQVYGIPLVYCLKSSCTSGLGLESGEILRSRLKSAPNTSDPDFGRLNHPRKSWCFDYSNIHGSTVEFVVDLGSKKLISGFQSQGPPLISHGKKYIRYVGLGVDLSDDGRLWRRCCGDNHTDAMFYANDEQSSAEIIETHAFKTLQSARYVRIFASSDVRWIGDSEKCFRFEILGCPTNFSVDVGLKNHIYSEGLISATWKNPVVTVPENQSLSFPSSYYLVRITNDIDGESQVSNVSGHGSIIVNRPLWGAKYRFELSCAYQNVEFDCGIYFVDALSESEAIFEQPMSISSTSLNNGSVITEWKNSNSGWRAESQLVTLTNKEGRVIFKGITDRRTLTFPTLPIDDYFVKFSPYDPNNELQTGKSTLAVLGLIPLKGDKDGRHQSFIGFIDLTLDILWSGSIIARWSPARAKGVDSELDAVRYEIKLINVTTSEVITEKDLSAPSTHFNFTGLNIGSTYRVLIRCIFPTKSLECGNEIISTAVPFHIEKYLNMTEIYVKTPLPDTWQNLKRVCYRSSGHLTSLDRRGLEDSLSKFVSVKDFWTGGNICKNSPAPAHSMWSDGSFNTNTNFAVHSGLDGSHCCVKSSISEKGGRSMWKGESCSTILYGVCEYIYEDIIDNLKNVSAYGSSISSIVISWSTEGRFWQPTLYEIRICYIKSLSQPELTGNETCRTKNITGEQNKATFENLSVFSEYSITINYSLYPYIKTAKTWTQKARTMPRKNVEFFVSSDGVFRITWLKKIAFFRDSESVKVNYSAAARNSTFSTVNGTALRSEISNLRLGEKYILYVEDEAGETFGPLTFEAYPNCTRGWRNGTFCFQFLSEKSSFYDRNSQCESRGFFSTRPLIDSELTALPNEVFGKNRGSLYWIQSNSSGSQNKNRTLCQAWSRSLNRYTFAECGNKLPIICYEDLKIQMITPSKKDLKIASGPTHITLDWSSPSKGWLATYTINYTDNNRKKRQVYESEIHAENPPVNITGLVPQTRYFLTVVTSLNEANVRYLTVDGILTTADQVFSAEVGKSPQTQNEFMFAKLSMTLLNSVILIISIILLAWSRTLKLYTDNLIQFCFELSTICFYICIILTVQEGPLTWNLEEKIRCWLTIFLLNYFTMCSFVFALIESMIIAHRVVDALVLSFLSKNSGIFVVLGFGLPFVYVLSVVISFHEPLTPKLETICWVNLDAKESSILLAPMGVVFCLTLLFSLLSLCGTSKERILSSDQVSRIHTLFRTRYAVFLIGILLGSSWILGITSAHFKSGELLILFLALHFFMCLVILFLRILYDREIISRIKRSRMSSREVEEQYATEQERPFSRKASGLSNKSLRHHPRSFSSNSITPVERNETGQPPPPSISSATSKLRPMTTRVSGDAPFPVNMFPSEAFHPYRRMSKGNEGASYSLPAKYFSPFEKLFLVNSSNPRKLFRSSEKNSFLKPIR